MSIFDIITRIKNELNFSESAVDENTYFNDCYTNFDNRTTVIDPKNIVGSIPYRHGIEIRNQNSYVGGFVKVVSGESGHAMSHTLYGQDVMYDQILFDGVVPKFLDMSSFNPVNYLKGEVPFPIIINNPGEQSYLRSGHLHATIEPLTIRDVINVRSLYFPYEAHCVWGTVEDGNESHTRSTDAVQSVKILNDNSIIPFLDDWEVDGTSCSPGRGFYLWDENRLKPFVDAPNNHFVNNKLSGSITNVTSELNYRDNGHLSNEEIAQTSGFIFDGAILGTDSIAFGGMTYV